MDWRRFWARYIFPRATPELAISITIGPYFPPGTAMDQGLVPIFFFIPPHGAILGPALLIRMVMQPCVAPIRVKYIQVPKWLELRTDTTPTPCSFARETDS